MQAECLRQPLVEAGANLVYTAPTSAGKSLVADVLLLQMLRAHPDKTALLVSHSRPNRNGLGWGGVRFKP